MVLSIELLDELTNDLFGLHILEPIVTFEEQLKVKPMINSQYKPQTDTLHFMNKIQKRT